VAAAIFARTALTVLNDCFLSLNQRRALLAPRAAGIAAAVVVHGAGAACDVFGEILKREDAAAFVALLRFDQVYGSRLFGGKRLQRRGGEAVGL